MTNIIDSVSLIPYLESEASPFYLSLTPVRPDLFTDSKADSAFSVLSDAGAFTRLFAAELKNDAGQSVQSMFSFCQRDVYPFSNNLPAPFDNDLIENRWQELFSFYSGSSGAEFVILKRQISESGSLVPFLSLVYCRLKAVYFTLVCPHCSQPLSLCRDEQLLAQNGLSGYANSLKRYLCCPHCLQAGKTVEFYVTVKAPDDPKVVTDQAGLLKNMGRSDDALGKADSNFPCLSCDQRQVCYGPESRSLSRISVFSFYPFYMLLFHADKISSADYNKLVSGELFTQFKPGPAAVEDSISSVLKRILNRWQNEIPLPNDHSRQTGTDADLAATRIISGKAPDGAKPPERKVSEYGQAMERTVIISKKKASKEAGRVPPTDDLEQTRIIESSSKNRSAAVSSRQPVHEHPADSRRKSAGEGQAGELSGENGKPKDAVKDSPEAGPDLEKTVIIGRGKTRAKDK